MFSIPHVGSERLKENHVVSSDRGKRQRLRFKEGAALAADGISLARLLGGHLEERGEEGLQGESNFGLRRQNSTHFFCAMQN